MEKEEHSISHYRLDGTVYCSGYQYHGDERALHEEIILKDDRTQNLMD